MLDRLNSEVLDPLITLVFERLQANGMLPPLPEELQGVELNVDFISILAQSQKAVTTNAIDRFVNSLNAVAGMKQEVLDKFNADRWADTYADSLGIDAQLIVPDKEVAKLREARAQAQAQQAQLEQAQQAASTMKDVAQAQIDPMQPQDINNLFAGY